MTEIDSKLIEGMHDHKDQEAGGYQSFLNDPSVIREALYAISDTQALALINMECVQKIVMDDVEGLVCDGITNTFEQRVDDKELPAFWRDQND